MIDDGDRTERQRDTADGGIQCDSEEGRPPGAGHDGDHVPGMFIRTEKPEVTKRRSCSPTAIRPRGIPGFSRQSGALAKLCERLKREIRERKRVQSELQRKELHFRRLVETMNSGLVIQDEYGNVTYVNDKLLQISGYERQDFIGRPIDQILSMVHASNRSEVLEKLEKRKKGESASYELKGKRKDGGRLSVLVSPRPLLDEKGQFRGSFAVVTDILELKEAEERFCIYGEQLQSLSHQLLKTQETERGRLSRELHDDLGQALVALKLSVKTIRLRLESERKDELCSECALLTRLVDEIVQRFRELCGNMSPLIIEDLGLAETMRMLMEDFASCQGTVCDVNVDDLDDVLDPEAQILIYRVLQECLNNVAKHAAASRVSFEFKRESGRAVFRMKDNGIGFVQDHYQSGRLKAKNLGLITMAERVRVLGGSLDINSVKGSTSISFSIPLQA